MVDDILLQNIFYAFYYCCGDYFLLVLGYFSFIAIVFSITHILTRR